ncbi:allophanate hydrolase subunit 1 [Vibrio sp. NTOU-M3]|uniref:5-oxoprolinase subunit B family protein n=1 Tax=Vibrio sp. NTOU-M3 TaxID=3234954 RepID=UPI00349F2781
MFSDFAIDPVSESSLLIRFNSPPSVNLSRYIGHINDQLREQLSPWIMNITPAFNTLLVDYLPYRIHTPDIVALINKLLIQATNDTITATSQPKIELPVYYDLTVGPDLTKYHQQGYRTEDVIQLHSKVTYTVGAIGFSAGFAFLSGLNSQISLPRHNRPRLKVAKGSVAIAEDQTAVYPSESPGGWNIIGNCPLELYQPTNHPMIPFEIGTQVTFRPIGKQEFLSLGGVLPQEGVNE